MKYIMNIKNNLDGWFGRYGGYDQYYNVIVNIKLYNGYYEVSTQAGKIWRRETSLAFLLSDLERYYSKLIPYEESKILKKLLNK